MILSSLYTLVVKLNFLSNGERFLLDSLEYYPTLRGEKKIKFLSQTV